MATQAASDQSLTGRVLVAMPGIGDDRFERSVIFICAYDAEHAMGLTINRPINELTLPDLLERLGIPHQAPVPREFVLQGGPVESDRGFVLHTDDYGDDESTLRVRGGIALTPTRHVLEALAGKSPRPRRAVLALGYAGWGPGQLERELQQNVWLVSEPNEALVFDDDHDRKWAQALALIGVDPAQLSPAAGRA